LRVTNKERAYIHAEKAYSRAEQEIVTAPKDQQVAMFPAFIKALQNKNDAIDAMANALDAQHREQVKHPLGLC
jgi:hypothetical protein